MSAMLQLFGFDFHRCIFIRHFHSACAHRTLRAMLVGVREAQFPTARVGKQKAQGEKP
jgi:hypothetical protein